MLTFIVFLILLVLCPPLAFILALGWIVFKFFAVTLGVAGTGIKIVARRFV